MTFDDLAQAARDICRETTGTTSSVAQCLWYCFGRNNDPYDVIHDIIECFLEKMDEEDEHEHE